MRTNYQNELDKAELTYKKAVNTSLSKSQNSKTWWQTVKKLLGHGCDDSYPSFKNPLNDSFIATNNEKDNAFNDYFLSHNNIYTSGAKLPENGNYGGDVYLNKIEASEERFLIVSKILI